MRTIGGYGNVQGDNPGETRKGWAKRIPGQAKLIKSMGVDWFVALELHSEKGAHLPLMRELGPEWGIHLGRAGNHLLHRKAVGVTLRSSENFALGGGKQNRGATWWRVTQNGLDFSVLGAHFISEAVYLPTKILQARTLVKFTELHQIKRGILGVDLNSSSAAPGLPRWILRQAGWGGLRYKCDRVTNAWRASGVHSGDAKPGAFGKWIEDLMTQDYVKVVSAEGVLTDGLSDHQLWLKGTFDIRDKS